MEKTTESRLVQILKEGAARRYGSTRARELGPALRETAKAIAGTKDRDLALEDEPAFFSRSTRIR